MLEEDIDKREGTISWANSSHGRKQAVNSLCKCSQVVAVGVVLHKHWASTRQWPSTPTGILSA